MTNKIRGFHRFGGAFTIGLAGWNAAVHSCPVTDERTAKHIEMRSYEAFNPVGQLTTIANSSSGNDVTVALTGVSASGVVGTLSASSSSSS
jgi:hypothetical protein